MNAQGVFDGSLGLFDDKSKFLHFGGLKKVTFLKLPNALVYLTLE
jgi:hypothetical protein